MNRSHFIRKSAALVIVLAGFYLFWRSRSVEVTQRETSLKLTPAVANGAVVFKSFQNEAPTLAVPDISREPASQRKNRTKARLIEKNRTSIKKRGKKDDDIVHLNGAPYVWLRLLAAKKIDGSSNTSSPDGYSLSTLSVPRNDFGAFDSDALFVVTDRLGVEKKVITGAFVIEIHDDLGEADAIAKSLDLEVTYLAPQINTAILQARSGQNLFRVEASLRADPRVSKVTLEILGKGATTK
ncbi:MAG: hypothetical protein KF802_04285 [Bdellovibrionaceae bacterium]|nr:hypothetical protein [Pseudobdellovibrionaceae bacterium]